MDALLELASQIGGDGVKTISLLPHNQKLYNDIKSKVLGGERSIFFSEGTGLGKSYVFMKIVEELFPRSKVLYIVPKIAIWNNLTHYPEFGLIDKSITMTTFAAFNKSIEEGSYFFEHDVVFVDECHHMLSDIQGKNVKQFLDRAKDRGKYVFGMTATPEVNGVFVDEECFDVSCYGLDMYEAIEQGLMPKMDIAIGIKEEIEIPDNLREKYSIVSTKTLLETVLSDYNHVTHWLAYFTTKEELEQSESEMRKLFPEYIILKAYTGLDNIEEVIKKFENTRRPVILMSVAMLLEGMHLKNVGGVLLYRNVQKSHTYAQILGRLCVIGQKYTPVIVDIPGAILSIREFYVSKSKRAADCHRKVYTRKDVFDVTSRGYELLELAKELFPVAQVNTWTEDEIVKLRSLDGFTLNDMAAELPNKTKRSIYQKAYILGISIAHMYRDFSEEEIAIVRDNYASMGTGCLKLLTNRTKGEVVRLASKLGLRREFGYIPQDTFEEIVADLKTGYTVEKLSAKYGIDKKIIKRRLDEGGYDTLTVRRFSDEEKTLMRRLGDEGYFIADILDAVNAMDCNKDCPRPLGSVKSFLQRTGGYTRKIEYIPEETVKIICEAAKTCTVSEIVQKYVPEYKPEKVWGLLHRLGVHPVTRNSSK